MSPRRHTYEYSWAKEEGQQMQKSESKVAREGKVAHPSEQNLRAIDELENEEIFYILGKVSLQTQYQPGLCTWVKAIVQVCCALSVFKQIEKRE